MSKREYRRFTGDQELAIFREADQPGVTVAKVCRRHGLPPSVLYRWRAVAQDGSAVAWMVRSCINALIDMGRSATLVMPKESGPYPTLNRWYESRMAELMQSAHAPMMKFFRERRVHSIHKGVVRPRRDIELVTGSTVLGVAAGATIVLWRLEGTVEYVYPSDGAVCTVSRCST